MTLNNPQTILSGHANSANVQQNFVKVDSKSVRAFAIRNLKEARGSAEAVSAAKTSYATATAALGRGIRPSLDAAVAGAAKVWKMLSFFRRVSFPPADCVNHVFSHSTTG